MPGQYFWRWVTEVPAHLFQTGKLYELDMVCSALKEAEIPYFTRQETVSGVKYATPAMPEMGPGVFYSVIVTEEVSKHARQILKNLPVEEKKNPEIWDYNPTKKAKKLMRIYIIALIPFVLLVFLIQKLFS